MSRESCIVTGSYGIKQINAYYMPPERRLETIFGPANVRCIVAFKDDSIAGGAILR
jgi:hypothetical protein